MVCVLLLHFANNFVWAIAEFCNHIYKHFAYVMWLLIHRFIAVLALSAYREGFLAISGDMCYVIDQFASGPSRKFREVIATLT